ncbi:MAG: iron-sulfur cluster repair di-iron protein [Opitutaceae bacterium]|nr:iron-sulfur cluster repair di-iron protein [Opitutaceae bacterium]
MQNITPESTVGDIVRAAPARARIFEALGIDYCCGGKKSLAEAARARNYDPATVIALLAAQTQEPGLGTADPDRMGLAELCDHIESVHHAYLREELPRLDFMTRKVAAVHGDHEPRLLEVRQVFAAFNAEVSAHTQEEEAAIFPVIRRLEAATADKAAVAGGLKAALDQLETEHDSAGAALVRLKDLTDNYTPPEWACNTFRALYHGLAQLEARMHQHVHQENNVLFPKVLAAA